METTALDSFIREIAAKPPAEKAKAIREAVDNLTYEATASGIHLPDADQPTANKVWLIIIWCFGIVMLGAVMVLGISVFAAPVTGGTKPETILTVFMTVTAFLAGLFAPSPVQKRPEG